MPHNNNNWKACNRHKRFPSSNLGHSAKNRHSSDVFRTDDKSIKASKKVARSGAKTAKQAHRGRNCLVDILEHYKDVHVATSMVNRHLKDIASDLGLPPITTYTARYTWATLALSIDTPIEVISQALGHSYGQAVTLGYIMPDRRKVDNANSKVLGLIVSQKK